jgi:histidinol dehydrogenase
VCDNDRVLDRLTRAGTVFVGALSAQALGDYVTGSNHVLPTSGAARARGGLSAADFVRVATVQTVTRGGMRRIGPHGIALAVAEGLEAHAESMRIRVSVAGKRGPEGTAALGRPERAARRGRSGAPAERSDR